MKIKIEIKLGNDAMRTPGDVAWALAKLQAKVGALDTLDGVNGLTIRDINGNLVGMLTVEHPHDDRDD